MADDATQIIVDPKTVDPDMPSPDLTRSNSQRNR